MSDPSHINSADLSMRNMRSNDLRQVLAIENTAQASPWSRLSFEESLTREHICRVLVSQEEVRAFHVVCPIVDELHILNLVVAKPAQGLGVSHALMNDILQTALERELTKIFLEVRASNTVAQSLYQKWQFQQIAVRKNYYSPSSQTDNRREDALVLARIL